MCFFCTCSCLFVRCFLFLLFSVLVSWRLRPVDKMTSLRFNFLSLNVRGLRNQVKRRSVFRYLKDQNCLLYLLQETFSELKDEMEMEIALDHKAVKLCLQFTNHRRGPGLWKFNNMLLKDDNFVCLIKENYPSTINKYREVHDKRLLWELIKMEIKFKDFMLTYISRIAKRTQMLPILTHSPTSCIFLNYPMPSVTRLKVCLQLKNAKQP